MSGISEIIEQNPPWERKYEEIYFNRRLLYYYETNIFESIFIFYSRGWTFLEGGGGIVSQVDWSNWWSLKSAGGETIDVINLYAY